jgi:DUF1365 family protein
MKSEFFISFIKHIRFIPKKYEFDYRFFWMKIDLDELNQLDKETRYFSRNKFNLVSYYDHDHLNLGFSTTKENMKAFLKENGVIEEIIKIELVTNPRILGYTFNPVSFYFIETATSPYMVIEIGNTYKEIKPYFVPSEYKMNNEWLFTTPKFFYISPFISAQNNMTFKVIKDDKSLLITIDDINSVGAIELKAIFTGKSLPWSSRNLIYLFFSYPLNTFRIILAIHYHAFKLFRMKIPYWRKNDEAHLQKDLFTWKDGSFRK